MLWLPITLELVSRVSLLYGPVAERVKHVLGRGLRGLLFNLEWHAGLLAAAGENCCELARRTGLTLYHVHACWVLLLVERRPHLWC